MKSFDEEYVTIRISDARVSATYRSRSSCSRSEPARGPGRIGPHHDDDTVLEARGRINGLDLECPKNSAKRDHEQVAPADRVVVPTGIAEIIPGDNILIRRIAERAFHRLHAPGPL